MDAGKELKGLICPCVAQCLPIVVNALKSHCCVEGCQPVEPKHSLEGLWEGDYSGTPEIILIHTVRGKPGYLFGTNVIGDKWIPAKKVSFWLRSGDGMFKNVLEGKGQLAGLDFSERE